MEKKVLIIKGYSKSEIELANDRKIIQLYIDFFISNAGGCFDPNEDIDVFEEPELEEIIDLRFLNEVDYLVVVLIGHGANKDGTQIFQLQKDVLILPGQIQFNCLKQLHIIESCRNIVDFELDIKRLPRLIAKYQRGGVVNRPLTREESFAKFNEAVKNADNGIIYLFACDIDESAYNYFFLQKLIDTAVYAHEYYRENVFNVSSIFNHVKEEVKKISKGKQNPIKVANTDLPFVITIN